MITTNRPKKWTSTLACTFACVGVFAASLFWVAGAYAADTNDMDTLAAEIDAKPIKLQDLTTKASELGMRAMSLLGIRYKYGGNSPELGLDCSGLVRYLFKETLGENLPRTAVELSRLGQHVEPKDLQTGDLVFYNTLRRGFSHVGVYLGENKFIHSPASGGEVRIESMDVGYWKKRFNGARRLADPGQ